MMITRLQLNCSVLAECTPLSFGMAVFVALLALALVAPFFPLIVAVMDRQAAILLTRPGRIVRRSAFAGSLGILPVGFLFTVAAYGDWIVLLLIALIGSLYGALVGAVIAWLRPLRFRDRTG